MDLSLIKQLRDGTGASIADCKVCLDQAGGDLAKARELLRKRGAEIAQKKSTRSTEEGCIGSYVHSNGKIASLVALKCETDFVARNDAFKTLAKDIAMHITAAAPLYRTPEEVPTNMIEKEKEIEREKLLAEGKPERIIEQALVGKIKKYYQEVCLSTQLFVKDDKKTIGDLLQEHIQQLGENIEIAEFARLQL